MRSFEILYFFCLLGVISNSHVPRLYGKDIKDAPVDWEQRIAEGQMMYTDVEPAEQLQASIGNGYLATVVGSDTIYLAGVFNGLNTETPSHRARIPATNAIKITSGKPIGSALDIGYGTFYRRVQVADAIVEQRWFAHRSLRSLLIHTIYINNTRGKAPASVDLINNSGPASSDISFSRVVPGSPGLDQFSGKINIPEEPDSLVVSVAVTTTHIPQALIVDSGLEVTYYFITAIRSSLDSSSPVYDSLRDYNFAVLELADLHKTHLIAWQEIWNSGIEIGGNLQLARVINTSLYYILSSVRADWPYSLSPGGLASNGYNGHSFWDCETWMYPGVLLLHPDIALGLLQYRELRTNGAAQKAKSYNKGYQGYMFPWESAFTGQEVCPSSAPTGQLEQHITADIAFAIKQYWDLNQDPVWLRTFAYPVLYGIAEFWASRVERDGGLYVINNIIPPDEYAVNVNNSVFTNVAVGIALNFTIWCANTLGLSVPNEWSQIAKNLKIPFDASLQIHKEFDTYHGETIKQADVVLLGFPLMFPMSREIRYNDLMYYLNRTDPGGPAMTYAMHVIAFLELGLSSEASELWDEAWANARSPFWVWTETPTGGTVNFITGAGGFLQGVLFGYGGIRLLNDSLKFDPQLPPNSDFVRFRQINYLRAQIDVSFDQQLTRVTLAKPGLQTLTLKTSSSSMKLSVNDTISFKTQPFTIFPTSGGFH